MTADRAVAAIERALAADGPLTRAQLAERITAVGVRTQGQALAHLLVLASLRGIAIRGPMIGRQHGYVLVRDWLAAPPPQPGRDRALAVLASRYLAGHGPVGEKDLARWAGLPLRDARRGWRQTRSTCSDFSAAGDGPADRSRWPLAPRRCSRSVRRARGAVSRGAAVCGRES